MKHLALIMFFAILASSEICHAADNNAHITDHQETIGMQEFLGTYPSPLRAGIISYSPFWSGSWSVGFTWTGLSLVLVKSLGVAVMLYALTVLPSDDPGSGDVWFIGFLGYGAGAITDFYYSSGRVNEFNIHNGIERKMIRIDTTRGVTVSPYPVMLTESANKRFSLEGTGLMISMRMW